MPSAKKLTDAKGDVGEVLAADLCKLHRRNEALPPTLRGRLGPRKRANPTTLAAIRDAKAGKTTRIRLSDC